MNKQNLIGLAYIISIIKYVHFILVMTVELAQPTSYFLWKNESKNSLIQEV